MGKDGQMHSIVKTYSLRQAAHEWEDNHNCRIISPSQRETFKTPQQVPQSRDPSPGRQAPRTPASGLPFRRGRGRLHASSAHKLSHAPSPGIWGVIWKEPGQISLLIWESLPEGQEATGTPSGDTDAGGSHLGELIHHEDAGAEKHHFRVPPLATISTLPTSRLAPALLMHRPGLACQHTESSWPCHHTEGPCSLRRRHPYTMWGSPHGSLLLW